MTDNERGKLVRLAKKLGQQGPRQPKEEKEQIEYASLLVLGGRVWEQVHYDGESGFISWNSDKAQLEKAGHLMRAGVKFLPLRGEELAMGAVKLPEEAEEFGDPLTLLAEIEGHILKWLDVSGSFRRFAAYYVMLSWLFDRFHTLPYLRFLGDTGTGKSRALDVTGGLCYKPIMASGCITPAPIYRMIRRWGGTVVLDEADIKGSDEYHEVVTILNCGFERNRPVIRATKDNPDKLQFLPTYGPKVFATRRRFQDPALEARCLTEIMSETTRDDIPPVLNSSFFENEASLRRRLLMFRLRNWANTDAEAGRQLHFDGLEPRLRQVSSSFAALFANQPAVLADYAEFIGRHQRELIEQRAATRTGQVVVALFNRIETSTLGTLGTFGTGSDEAQVLNVSPGNIADDTKMTAQAVGQMLKTLGLRTRQVKVAGEKKRCVVFDEAKLAVLRKRYIPADDEESPRVPAVPRTPYSDQSQEPR